MNWVPHKYKTTGQEKDVTVMSVCLICRFVFTQHHLQSQTLFSVGWDGKIIMCGELERKPRPVSQILKGLKNSCKQIRYLSKPSQRCSHCANLLGCHQEHQCNIHQLLCLLCTQHFYTCLMSVHKIVILLNIWGTDHLYHDIFQNSLSKDLSLSIPKLLNGSNLFACCIYEEDEKCMQHLCQKA